MRIGIISIYDIQNLGNRLQNYALQSVLKKMGHQPYTIKVDSRRAAWKRKLKSCINYSQSWLKTLQFHSVRASRFLAFERKYIAEDAYYYDFARAEDQARVNQKYDCFIAGSDQIWNPHLFSRLWPFLSFSKDSSKNISYAASFGVHALEEKCAQERAPWLKRIPNISVREASGAQIVRELTGREAPVLIDPTMLLDESEWERIEKRPRGLGDAPYILTYFLGEVSSARQKNMETLAAQKGCVLLQIGARKDQCPAGPREFVYLVHHAQLVLTDSFHCCVFSILFKRPFLALKREDNLFDMSDRITTLLQKFHLEDRLGSEEEIPKIGAVDYGECAEMLARERRTAKEFLETALARGGDIR